MKNVNNSSFPSRFVFVLFGAIIFGLLGLFVLRDVLGINLYDGSDLSYKAKIIIFELIFFGGLLGAQFG